VRSQRRRQLVEDGLRECVRQIPKVVGIELAKHGDKDFGRGILDQVIANAVTHFHQRLARLRGCQLAPDQRSILGRQRLQNFRDVGRVQRPQPQLQLDQVLPVLHLLEQTAASGLLTPCDAFEQPVPLEQPPHFGDLLLQSDFGCGIHRLSASLSQASASQEVRRPGETSCFSDLLISCEPLREMQARFGVQG